MTRGASGAATKDAIRQAAACEFRAGGYSGTSLQGIAERLGMTRAAVLHHYGTKEHLLEAVLEPFLADFEAMLSRHEESSALDVRELLTDLVELLLAYRNVAGILAYDVVASRGGPVTLARGRACCRRLTAMLAGPHPSDADRVVVAAVVGAVLRPVADPTLDLADAASKAAIAAVADHLGSHMSCLLASAGADGPSAA